MKSPYRQDPISPLQDLLHVPQVLLNRHVPIDHGDVLDTATGPGPTKPTTRNDFHDFHQLKVNYTILGHLIHIMCDRIQ